MTGYLANYGYFCTTALTFTMGPLATDSPPEFLMEKLALELPLSWALMQVITWENNYREVAPAEALSQCAFATQLPKPGPPTSGKAGFSA